MNFMDVLMVVGIMCLIWHYKLNYGFILNGKIKNTFKSFYDVEVIALDGMKLENAKVVFDECKIDIDDVITEHDSKLCIFNSYVNCKGIIPYNSVLQVENDSINTNGGNALHCDNNSIIKAENSIFECGKEDNDACGIYYGDAKFIYITGCHFNGYDMGMIFPARTKNIQSKIDSIKKSEIELREDENGQKTCYYFD